MPRLSQYARTGAPGAVGRDPPRRARPAHAVRLALPTPGSESEPLADALVHLEPELDARPPGQDLAAFRQRPSGMGPGDRAVVVVKISGVDRL